MKRPTFRKSVATPLAVTIAVAACATLGPFAGAAGATQVGEGGPRLVVGFAADTPVSQQVAELRDAGLDGVTAAQVREKAVPQLDVAAVEVPAGDLAAVRSELRADPDVAWVEVDHVAHATWDPGDPRLSSQWGLGKVGAYPAWDTTRGAGVTIAVVDTGVSYIHADLWGRVDLGRDFVAGDDDPMDEQGHGTHVAGIAAAIAGNGTGIAGVAPDARILAVRSLDGDGAGYYSWIASGITYAADNGAKVINLSLGGPQPSRVLEEAVAYAAARGAVLTCATGNEGSRNIGYPAKYPGCVAVGASNSRDAVAGFSNRGSGIDVVAPGASILSTTMDGSYEAWDGTSMAAPYASGVAALLASRQLSHRQVVHALLTTAVDLGPAGWDAASGRGRIDAAAAVAAAARLPAAPADSADPVVTAIEVGPRTVRYRSTRRPAWRRASVSTWRVVGRTGYRGEYRWNEVRRGSKRRITKRFRVRGGVVRRQTIVDRKFNRVVRSPYGVRVVRLGATDDVAVDRVALKVGGRFIGADWTAADGWHVTWPCVAGSHEFTALAFDARDRLGVGTVTNSVTC